MCVIIFKPANTRLPGMDILKMARLRNPDGMGFCSPTNSYKTLSWDVFKKRLRLANEDEPMLIHFRFATQGGVRRSNCHPFHDKDTDVYFMHNGILPGFYNADGKTDSEMAFDQMKPALAHGLYSGELEYAVRRVIGGSRFAFMQGDNVRLFGGFLLFDGCYYSNLRFFA